MRTSRRVRDAKAPNQLNGLACADQGHPPITQHREAVEFAVPPQQFQVDDPVAVAAEDHLPRVPTLRNMMRDVACDYTRQSGHEGRVTDAGHGFVGFEVTRACSH